MQSVIHGFLPLRRKSESAQELNPRWGDVSISAPMQGGWNSQRTTTRIQDSPDSNLDQPPTPPQPSSIHDGFDVVVDSGDEGHDEFITIRIPVNRINRSRSKSNTPFGVQPRSPPYLTQLNDTPLPPSTWTKNQYILERNTNASPSLGGVLSPVDETFAKQGPSRHASPVYGLSRHGSPVNGLSRQGSPVHGLEMASLDQWAVDNAISQTRRTRDAPEGLSQATMTSQGLAASLYSQSSAPHIPRAATAPLNQNIPYIPRSATASPAVNVEVTSRRRAPSVEGRNRRGVSADPIARRRTPANYATPVFPHHRQVSLGSSDSSGEDGSDWDTFPIPPRKHSNTRSEFSQTTELTIPSPHSSVDSAAEEERSYRSVSRLATRRARSETRQPRGGLYNEIENDYAKLKQHFMVAAGQPDDHSSNDSAFPRRMRSSRKEKKSKDSDLLHKALPGLPKRVNYETPSISASSLSQHKMNFIEVSPIQKLVPDAEDLWG